MPSPRRPFAMCDAASPNPTKPIFMFSIVCQRPRLSECSPAYHFGPAEVRFGTPFRFDAAGQKETSREFSHLSPDSLIGSASPGRGGRQALFLAGGMHCNARRNGAEWQSVGGGR